MSEGRRNPMRNTLTTAVGLHCITGTEHRHAGTGGPATRTGKALTALAVTALVAAACSGTASKPGGSGAGSGIGTGSGTEGAAGTGGDGLSKNGDGPSDQSVIELDDHEIVLTAGLVRFDACDALLDHLRSEAADRVGPWGFGDEPYFDDEPHVDMEMAEEPAAEAASAADAAEAPAESQADPVEGVDYSGTNVQEAGVDEADIIKTDGRRIFVMSGGRLEVVDAARREVLGSVRVVSGRSPELFLAGDSLLAIHNAADGGSEGPEAVIQRIRVRGGVPEIVETLRVEGAYVSARSVGATARVILRSQPELDFSFVFPSGNPDSKPIAEEANRSLILASTLEDWLPSYSLRSFGGPTSEGLLSPCDRVHAPTVFSGFGVTTVLSVPVAGPMEVASATSVLAPGDTVYASPESMYVSTTTWIDPHDTDVDWEQVRAEYRTNIHRFDISDPAGAVYTASGSVPGEIHNQFSLSEHGGHLRIVTTTGDRWSTDSESWVRVLAESDGRLAEVGSVGDIGRGERVQSVRFAGDIGYVVTFRQIDPFYTIDLSDPSDPRILGELKIPGFSSYLHPIGGGFVLGVGSDADDSGRVTGAKVSLFDVSDLADPQEVAVWTAPSGWNDIAWDHRAFLWWAPESVAVIPVTVDYGWSGAVVLEVADGTIEEKGRIAHLGQGAATGTSLDNCRELTAANIINNDDLSEDDYPAEDDAGIWDAGLWIAWNLLFEPENYPWLLLACDSGETGSRAGLVCEFVELTTEDAASIGRRFDFGAHEELWGCLDEHDAHATPVQRIVRSLVIGTELWTLSYPYRYSSDAGGSGRLQVNNLTTLEFLDEIDV